MLKLGFSADRLTALGVVMSACAAVAIAMGFLPLGLLLLVLTLRPAFQLSPLSLYQTSSRPAYLLCFGAFLFVVTESSTGPGKLFKETNVAHVGVHG